MECSVRTYDEKGHKIFNIEITRENYSEQLFISSILGLIRYTYLVTKVTTYDEKGHKIFNIEITTEKYSEQLFVSSILDLIRYTNLVTKSKSKKVKGLVNCLRK